MGAGSTDGGETLADDDSLLDTQAVVRVRDGKGVKHEGIKVEFVGSIGTFPSHLMVPLPHVVPLAFALTHLVPS